MDDDNNSDIGEEDDDDDGIIDDKDADAGYILEETKMSIALKTFY